MQVSSKRRLIEFLEGQPFGSVLDAPSDGGLLPEALGDDVLVDSIDLYVSDAAGYRTLWQHDLDEGLPAECGGYDLVCCCESLEHVGGPLLLLRHFHRSLNDGGMLIVTTPNVWYPQARLQFMLRGFFLSFPSLAGKVRPGTHTHITPWSWPQLYVFLKRAGFSTPAIIEELMSKPRHWYEHILGLPAKWYCRHKLRKAKTEEERAYWEEAGSGDSRLCRHLMVSVVKQGNASCEQPFSSHHEIM